MEEKNIRLRDLRKHLNLSQKEMAELLNMSGASGVSNIENGYNELTDNHIRLLKERLYINPDWLNTGNGSIFLVMTNKKKLLSLINRIEDDDDPVLSALLYLLEANRLSDFIKTIRGGSL